jgi:D-isomer specific 2-hydroxyacid dehydrogenase, NAD binding domain
VQDRSSHYQLCSWRRREPKGLAGSPELWPSQFSPWFLCSVLCRRLYHCGSQIAGAAIDAFENEPLKEVSLTLASHPNVICTPHIGASTKESQFRVARDIANYLNDALASRKYFGVVNADSLDMHLRTDLQPWVDLADRVGQLQASLLGQSPLDKVLITFQGAKLSDSTVAGTLKNAVLRGLFQVVCCIGVCESAVV